MENECAGDVGDANIGFIFKSRNVNHSVVIGTHGIWVNFHVVEIAPSVFYIAGVTAKSRCCGKKQFAGESHKTYAENRVAWQWRILGVETENLACAVVANGKNTCVGGYPLAVGSVGANIVDVGIA